MRRLLSLAIAVVMAAAFGVAGSARADDAGYQGAPRTFLWNPSAVTFTNTEEFKKEGPYVVGFSNASISNIWRVAMLHSIQQAAADNSDRISKLIITDANDSPSKQVADIQDLLERDVDILIVSAATSDALDPIVTRATNRGVPVVMVDRRVTSDNFVTFVTASDIALGRHTAQWIVEKLNYEGNVIMLPGLAGASPAELRIAAAKEVFNQYPGINILDLQYTDWSPAKGKQVMSALIQKYGDEIDGVWADSGLQGAGSMEAFLAAGIEGAKIPPHTCGDLNQCIKLATEHGIRAMSFDYPPSMGGVSVQVALDILDGKPVPFIYEINAQIAVSRGHETTSIKADLAIEDYALMDRSGDIIVSAGLGPNYDPQTFSVDYPK